MDDRKEFAPFSIPRREAQTIDAAATPGLTGNRDTRRVEPARASSGSISFAGSNFAEIEYEAKPSRNAAGEAALRFFSSVTPPAQIRQRPMDPIRQKFYDMRGLASRRPFARNDSELFYIQAKFMEDFTDDFDGSAKFSMYFPYYQHMGYEHLRTYFTWRTKARQGEIGYTSVSYAFLYIYELLSGIGVKDPVDGLNKLLAVWDKYLKYGPALGKYMPQWFKDYHVYYKLPHSFADFVKEHNLPEYYPEMFLFDPEVENSLEVWNRISDYSIITSRFYSAESKQLMRDCFNYVLGSIKETCEDHKVRIENMFLYRYSNTRAWHPFKQALFYNWLRQPDRKVTMPGQESYVCKSNRWSARLPIYYSNQKYLAGYIIKKTEACLRQTLKYKYKLKDDPPRSLHNISADIDLGKVIEKAVVDFHRELTRTVVTVDHANLIRIRKEAQGTQDKLIVADAAVSPQLKVESGKSKVEDEGAASPQLKAESGKSKVEDEGAVSPQFNDGDIWISFKDALSAIELKALAILLHGDADIKEFADENGLMLEVLMDSINEKAADYVGDNILETEDGMTVYDEYKVQVEKMVVGQT